VIPLPGRTTPEPQPGLDAQVSRADAALADAITETSANLGRWLFQSLEAVAEWQMGEQRAASERAKMDHEFRMKLLERR